MSDEPNLDDLQPEASLRIRIEHTRDRLIDAAAGHIIKMGKASPRLREAGLWLYGTATLLVPRGKEIPKLGQVGEHVLRGGQPSLRAFGTLRELGVDTVINLRPESDHERTFVERLGMKYLYMPLPPLDAPTHAMTMAFLDAATDPDNGTVFFHCFHGVDRTGTVAAALRIARDGWGVEQALAEMRAFNVHESGQRAKLDYLAEFHAYWQALPEAERRRTLHLPELVPAVIELPPKNWVQRTLERVGGWGAKLKARFAGRSPE
ncbi:MAG: hypothetical protein JWM80_5704 [Cyanobacteria bacterium RYN_339]|nr:hypothetical protein [Cyanobacteria bacterium RYN_339]